MGGHVSLEILLGSGSQKNPQLLSIFTHHSKSRYPKPTPKIQEGFRHPVVVLGQPGLQAAALGSDPVYPPKLVSYANQNH